MSVFSALKQQMLTAVDQSNQQNPKRSLRSSPFSQPKIEDWSFFIEGSAVASNAPPPLDEEQTQSPRTVFVHRALPCCCRGWLFTFSSAQPVAFAEFSLFDGPGGWTFALYLDMSRQAKDQTFSSVLTLSPPS